MVPYGTTTTVRLFTARSRKNRGSTSRAATRRMRTGRLPCRPHMSVTIRRGSGAGGADGPGGGPPRPSDRAEHCQARTHSATGFSAASQPLERALDTDRHGNRRAGRVRCGGRLSGAAALAVDADGALLQDVPDVQGEGDRLEFPETRHGVARERSTRRAPWSFSTFWTSPERLSPPRNPAMRPPCPDSWSTHVQTAGADPPVLPAAAGRTSETTLQPALLAWSPGFLPQGTARHRAMRQRLGASGDSTAFLNLYA